MPVVDLSGKLVEIRGQHVMLDADVATLYGVATRDINKAVKNNPNKFPAGYVFPLLENEKQELVENFHRFNAMKHSSVMPKVFSERGLYMLATILKGDVATQATLSIVETFAKVRELHRELICLHNEKKPAEQKTIMSKFGSILSDIVMPDLHTDESESTLELNFVIGKLKHTVKRKRISNDISSEQ